MQYVAGFNNILSHTFISLYPSENEKIFQAYYSNSIFLDFNIITAITNSVTTPAIVELLVIVGNMPDRTVYSLSDKGKDEFIATLKASILQFNYNTNVFSIAAFFLNAFSPCEQRELLEKRLEILQNYHTGIEKQVNPLWENEVSAIHSANVKRMIDLVAAEITGTKRLLESCNKNK